MRQRIRAAAALLGAVLLVAGTRRAAADPGPAVEAGDSSSGETRPIADLLREADAAFDRGDYPSARSLYDEAIRRGAGNARVLGRLALLISRDGDLDGSARLYRQALTVAPDDPDLMLGLGRVLVVRERYADAEALYRDMEERRIEPIRAHLGRAALLLAEGDLDKAGHFYRDVLRADPGNLEARIGTARVAHRQGLDRAARDQARNIVLDHPESREAFLLKQEIDRALAPRLDPGVSRLGDRGGNRVDQATVAYSFMAEPQTQIRISYWSYDATSRCKTLALCDELAQGTVVDQEVSTRAQILMAGVTSRLIAPLTFHARLGAAREETFGGGARSVAVGGGFIRWQVGPRFAIVGTGAREALADSAPLLDRGIRVDSAEIELAYAFHPSWTVSGSGGYGSYSDGNARETAGASLEWRLPIAHPWLRAALDTRYRAFNDDRQNGYFDPERYDAEVLIVEIRDSYRNDRITWRIEGTAGRQSFHAPPAAAAGPGEDRTVKAIYAALGVGFGTHAALEAFYSHSDYAFDLVTGFSSSRSGLRLTIRL